MKVDYNSMRKQMLRTYHDLCRKMNDGILKPKDGQYNYISPADPKEWRNTNIDGFVLVDASKIQESMDDLRSYITTLCCMYEDNDPDCKDLSEEIDFDKIASFNEQDNEN